MTNKAKLTISIIFIAVAIVAAMMIFAQSKDKPKSDKPLTKSALENDNEIQLCLIAYDDKCVNIDGINPADIKHVAIHETKLKTSGGRISKLSTSICKCDCKGENNGP